MWKLQKKLPVTLQTLGRYWVWKVGRKKNSPILLMTIAFSSKRIYFMVCTRNNRLRLALLSPQSLSSLAVHRSCCHQNRNIVTGQRKIVNRQRKLSQGSVKLERPRLQTELLQVQLKFFSPHTKSSELRCLIASFEPNRSGLFRPEECANSVS